MPRVNAGRPLGEACLEQVPPRYGTTLSSRKLGCGLCAIFRPPQVESVEPGFHSGLCHCHPTRAELACRITTGFQAVLRVLRSIPTMSPGIPYMPEARMAACGNPLTPGI